MEENTVEQVQNTQPEEKGERLFTQEEVNKIIKDRLSRAKADKAAELDFSAKESELAARESRLSCKEFILDNSLPTSMLECLDTSDVEAFKTKALSLSRDFGYNCQATPSFQEAPVPSGISEFDRDVKHEPLKW